jgi:hypothetical protein
MLSDIAISTNKKKVTRNRKRHAVEREFWAKKQTKEKIKKGRCPSAFKKIKIYGVCIEEFQNESLPIEK